MGNKLKEALARLRAQGHVVVDLPIHGEVRVSVDGSWLSQEEVKRMASGEPDFRLGLYSDILRTWAVMCGQIAGSNFIAAPVATQAQELRDEWTALIGSATPPPASYVESQKNDEKANALAGRMKAFLESNLQYI